jgi:hypothetical protein
MCIRSQGNESNGGGTDITATIVSERKVSFQDQEYSLTALTRYLLENDYNVQPGPHWYFDDRSLTDIDDATYALP